MKHVKKLITGILIDKLRETKSLTDNTYIVDVWEYNGNLEVSLIDSRGLIDFRDNTKVTQKTISLKNTIMEVFEICSEMVLHARAHEAFSDIQLTRKIIEDERNIRLLHQKSIEHTVDDETQLVMGKVKVTDENGKEEYVCRMMEKFIEKVSR